MNKSKLIKSITSAINASDKNTDYDAGMRNGMIWVLSLIDGKTPQFEELKMDCEIPAKTTDIPFGKMRELDTEQWIGNPT